MTGLTLLTGFMCGTIPNLSPDYANPYDQQYFEGLSAKLEMQLRDVPED